MPTPNQNILNGWSQTKRGARSGLGLRERRMLLFLGDIIAFGLAAVLSFVGWAKGVVLLPEIGAVAPAFVPIMFMVLLAWAGTLIATGSYDLRFGAMSGLQTIQHTFIATLVVSLGYVLLFFISAPLANSTRVLSLDLSWLAPFGLPRFVIVTTLWLATVSTIAWRMAYTRFFSRIQFQWRVLIVDPSANDSLAAHLLNARLGRDYALIGSLTAEQALALHTTAQSQLLEIVQQNSIDEIIIASDIEFDGLLRQALEDCHQLGVRVTPLPIFYEQLTQMVPIRSVGKQWYVALPFQNTPSLGFNMMKRLIDIGVACIGLLGLAVILPLLWLLIKFDDAGSVFFRQERLGLYGKRFWVWKLRTMKSANAGASQPAQNLTQNTDPRITRVGHWMRRIRLDELPQLINVLRGEMSLVGPRPDPLAFAEEWKAHVPFYRLRLSVKPGMTGWAQVNYGYVVSIDDAIAKLQYDLYYIKHRSLSLDMLILAKTIGVVLGMKGR
ncbi:MAG: sugar transferase [Anaerolineae bacterium]|nr:sugar transferase [Anaerolineae bacterium]